MSVFQNRQEAGRLLAEHLEHLAGESPIVLGIPRGGVPVAFEVASILKAPLDVLMVRKLGVPFQPELGFGAIGEDGVEVLNESVVKAAGITEAQRVSIELEQRGVLDRRVAEYRGDHALVSLEGRTVIVIDDGIATGGTARAAIDVARARGASRVVLATPVAAAQTIRALNDVVDEFVALEKPADLIAIGFWYRDFGQVPDTEVLRHLERSRAWNLPITSPPPPNSTCIDQDVTFTVDEHTLHGHLNVPDEAGAVIIFAHGSGSSRLSPRNRKVAEHLNHAGFGTFLFDLLDEGEAWDRQNVFDIPLLARRLVAATMWLREWPACRGIPFGYFGASTGAAAALTAAAEETSDVYAVVSRGGRPDLVPSRRLGAVRAPTLLIVGENDHPVREANVEVATHIRSAHRVEIVPGATHLFEEPGALSQVANLAASWFRQHLHTDLVASTPSAGAGD